MDTSAVPRHNPSKLRRQLAEHGLPEHPAADRFYCKCQRFCASWAEHPLGQPMSGPGFTRHRLKRHTASLRAQATLAQGPPFPPKMKPLMVEGSEPARRPGKYLLALTESCACGGMIYMTQPKGPERGWEVQCSARGCKLAASAGGGAGRPGPFAELNKWSARSAAEWCQYYVWVDELPAIPIAAPTVALEPLEQAEQPSTGTALVPAPSRDRRPPIDTLFTLTVSRSRLRSDDSTEGTQPAKRTRLSDARHRQLIQAFHLRFTELVEEQEAEDVELAREAERRRKEEEARAARAAQEGRDREWWDELEAKVAEWAGVESATARVEMLDKWMKETVVKREEEME